MDAFTVYAIMCMICACFNQGQAFNQCEVTDPYFCNNKDNGNYANHDYYHGFYTCSNKNVFCMECAPANPKLYYNPDKGYCDYEPPCPPLNAFCAIKMAGMTAAERSQPTRFANPMFKLGYVECQQNNHKCKKCQDDLKFNPSSKECGMSDPRSDCDKTFCESRADGDYHNPADRHGYITCSNADTYCRSCADSRDDTKLFFHRRDDMCKDTEDSDFPNRVVQSTLIRTQGSTRGSTRGPTSAPTHRPTTASTRRPTSASTRRTTSAPTSGTTSAPTGGTTKGPILGPIFFPINIPKPGGGVVHRIVIG